MDSQAPLSKGLAKMQKKLNVHIGEVKVCAHGEVLQAILGSCVGIGMIWKDRGMCGLAHCLLPSSEVSIYSVGARFVDQAIWSLLHLMSITPSDKKNIITVLAGGGDMTKGVMRLGQTVGRQNIDSALRELKRNGLPKPFSSVGGQTGRKIQIDSFLFEAKIEEIPRIGNIA